MIPTVTILEATGEVSAVDPGIDNTFAVLGCCELGSAGSIANFGTASGVYANRGEGPGSRLAGHVLKKNAGKAICVYYRMPSSTPGSFGTPDVSAKVGTTVIAVSGVPLNDYQLWLKVTDDGNDGAGTPIGTDGIRFQVSRGDGRNPSGVLSLGTAASYTIQHTGATVLFQPVAATLVVPANALRTKALLHFPKTSSSIHGAADSTSDDGIGSTATTNTNAITLINQLRTAILLHLARGATVHTTADITSGVGIGAAATTQQEALTLLLQLIEAFNTHVDDGSLYHGAADVADEVSTTTPDPGTLKTGDIIRIQCTGPKWATGDLTAGFTALGGSSADFGIAAVAGPVSGTEAETIKAGIDYLNSRGKRVLGIWATRDFTNGEAEADYVADVAADYSLFTDNRCSVCATPARCTLDDGNAVEILDTTALAAIVARLIGAFTISEAPSEVGRGALDGVTIVDTSGTLLPTAHDEGGDIQGLDAAHMMTLRRLPDPTRRNGTYLTDSWVMYAPDSHIFSAQVRRVANKAERLAAAIGWGKLGSAQVYVPGSVANTGTLSEPAANIIKKAVQAVLASPSGIRDNISNPDDPDLVTVDRNVTVSAGKIAVKVSLNVVMFNYIGSIEITLNVKL